jgi:hypothetical protein
MYGDSIADRAQQTESPLEIVSFQIWKLFQKKFEAVAELLIGSL